MMKRNVLINIAKEKYPADFSNLSPSSQVHILLYGVSGLNPSQNRNFEIHPVNPGRFNQDDELIV